ncbi:MAG: DUF4145 domain-containing protein [Spirochaetales bacterium]|jgi:hypothetical protein|nr:DUF4145 domain-containing protein [Spirochaetales bacterium]
MIKDYKPPEFEKDAFNCPHCNAYAHHEWLEIFGTKIKHPGDKETFDIYSYEMARCASCHDYSIWLEEELIYPKTSAAPSPIEDMPEDVKEDFKEARAIVNASPRGAAAILRLALEKLMPHIGGEGKNLDKKIGNLVDKGLPVEIQEALDSLRVIGNESVHPGELNMKDDTKTALYLFDILNFIVDTMIVQPKKRKEIFERLPSSKKEGIKNRDKKS